MPEQRIQLEWRISLLLDEAHAARMAGRAAEGVGLQRQARDLASGLANRFPADERIRQGLASVLYTLGAQLTETDDPAGAVVALDQCYDLYASLVERLADASLLLADVRLRRGLAQSARGWGASAIVDGDAALTAYLDYTSAQIDHPRWRDLARVLACFAQIQYRHGDLNLANSCAETSTEFYLHPRRPAGEPDLGAADLDYLRIAVITTTLRNLIDGNLAYGVAYALLLSNLLPTGVLDDRLHQELVWTDELLASKGKVPYPVDYGRRIAELLATQLKDSGLKWLPDPQTMLGESSPTLAEALALAAAAGAGAGADMIQEFTNCRPDRLLTPSMRWLPTLTLDRVIRLADLSGELLAGSHTAGLRLGFEAHALFASAARPRARVPSPAFADYGERWARLLVHCSAACQQVGDRANALDLAGWASRVAGTLVSETNGDATATATATALRDACFAHRARLVDPQV